MKYKTTILTDISDTSWEVSITEEKLESEPSKDADPIYSAVTQLLSGRSKPRYPFTYKIGGTCPNAVAGAILADRWLTVWYSRGRS